MTDSKLLDSSAWLEYFHNKRYIELIESNATLLSSSLSVFEIKKKLEKENQKKEFVMECLEFIRKRSLIISVNSIIAEHAAELSVKYNLGAIDALIYATAQKQKSILMTKDNDFRDLPNTEIFKD